MMDKPKKKRGKPYVADHSWKPRFLGLLRDTANVTLSAQGAGVARAWVYAERQRDESFAAEWNSALDEATDALEYEARRRAIKGLTRKKFTRSGDPIIDPETGEQYFEYEYSDTLLICLLNAHRPEKYRHRHEVTGKDGNPLFPSALTIVIDNGNSSGTTE